MSQAIGDVLVQGLWDLGVRYIFGVPGDIQTALFHALRERPDLHFVCCRNEKSAAFGADLYGRVARTVGVCFSTVGPGATNLVSGLANATMDRAGVVAISDQIHSTKLRPETHQYVAMERLFAPHTNVTKASFVLDVPEALPAVLVDAFTVASTEPKGAVHLAIPYDFYERCIPRPQALSIPPPERGHAEPAGGLAAVRAGIRAARTGLVIVGGAVSRAGAQREFEALVEATGFPVLTSFRGKGALRHDHPFLVGTLSRHSTEVLRDTFAAADTLLLVGYDLNEGVEPSAWDFGTLKTTLSVDLYDDRVPGVFEPTATVWGDLGHLCRSLADDAPRRQSPIDVAALRAEIDRTIQGTLDRDVYPLRPQRVMEALNAVFDRDTIYVCDVGNNKYYAGLLLRIGPGSEIHFSNGQSAMAFSSGAIGAKIADRTRSVVVVVGDGGFLMNPQELSTAVHYDLPIVIVVLRNNGYGLVRSAHERRYDDYHHTMTFPTPDFAMLARSYGAEGHTVRSHGDLVPALEQAKASRTTSVIDVPVEYSRGL